MISPSPSMQGMRAASGANVGPTSAGNIIPKGHRLAQIGQFSPQQMQLFSELFSHVSPQSYLSRLATGEEGADETSAWRDFQSALGGLSSRFSGMGTGAKQSSAFQNTLSQSASDFALALKNQRSDLQRNALKELFALSESLLGQRPSEQFLVQKQQKRPSFLQQLGLGAASGLSHAAGSAFGAFL
jgi:hypothetical protein